MRKPRLSDLQEDEKETRQIRSTVKKSKSVKITINIDGDSMVELKRLSEQTGVPYQRLLNRLLKEGLAKNESMETRLSKLEAELAELKKKFAA